jgi:hypothetical protein
MIRRDGGKMKCIVSGAENHHVISQGRGLWDYLDHIDEGEQFLCVECQNLWLTVELSRKVEVDPAMYERVKSAFEESYAKHGAL